MFFNVLDVGASGGKSKCFPLFTKNLNRLHFLFKYYGVEPNKNALLNIIGYEEVYTDAINITPGPSTLFITRDPYKTSLLKPNYAVVCDFKDFNDYQVKHEITVKCRTLKDLLGQIKVDIDIIKLDIQGLEANILADFFELNVPIIICEASSIEVYTGQTLSSSLVYQMALLNYGLLDITFKYNATHENDFIFIKNNFVHSNLFRNVFLKIVIYWYTGNKKLFLGEIKRVIKKYVFKSFKSAS